MASKSMTKSKIAEHLADKTGVKKRVAIQMMEELVSLAYQEAENGFTVPGLGKLVVQNRKARMGRNPQTGEQINIPAKKVCKFRIAKACKDSVLG